MESRESRDRSPRRFALRDQKLQQLHDGELPEAEAEALRAQLTPEDQEKLAALAEIDAAVASVTWGRVDDIDLWSGIAARLPGAAEAAPAEALPGAKTTGQVVPLAAAARKAPARRRWVVPLASIGGLLAVAAAFLVVLRPAPAPSNECEVERLEVAGAVATVMEVPGEQGDNTTVIWIDHEESDEWQSL